MDKLNKLSLPVVILVSSIILGGFYYATETNKQRSIERQQEIKLTEERRIEEEKAIEKKRIEDEQVAKEANDTLMKSNCVDQATASAVDYYKTACTYDCHAGQYYIATYEHEFKTCLQAAGL